MFQELEPVSVQREPRQPRNKTERQVWILGLSAQGQLRRLGLWFSQRVGPKYEEEGGGGEQSRCTVGVF